MPIIVPIKNDENHQITITLDNEVFKLRFLYSDLNDSWCFDIYNQDNDPLLTNIRLVPNFPLIKQYVNTGLPKGDFVCDGNINTASITRDSFSKNGFQILYLTEAEIGAI